ncbi:MAG: T9SS type A sorting domain-containing protein [Bacteroidetes bacterium]|nr:T9SS type A sorting domain-containing protein [Bacteroidota bacterium]
MTNVKHTFILIISFVFLLCNSYSQEYITPLKYNHNIILNKSKITNSPNLKPVFPVPPKPFIQLPFADDFSYAPNSIYPNTTYWLDSMVYVNCGYPIAPPSVGVATFDGLNKYGYPYTPNSTNTNAAQPADTLTSVPINLYTKGTVTLNPTFNVGLSFFYQRAGRGDNPESIDSLILDFYKPAQQTWTNNVWSLPGNPYPNNLDTIFRRVFVWVNDTSYFHQGFQFRFRNKCNTSGNFDQWHVDYIYMDMLRDSIADTTFNDQTFGYIPTPILNNYCSMPWRQFIPSEQAANASTFMRNNNNVGVNISLYNTDVYSAATNTLITSLSRGPNGNLLPFNTGGWSNFLPHSNPSYTALTLPAFTDSADFILKHYITSSATSTTVPWYFLNNDTVLQTQKFRNYFAPDDGSAEAGYYVLGSYGKMATKFKLNTADTLRSLRIYFDPVGSLSSVSNTLTGSTFTITLWADGGNKPGTPMYRNSSLTPKYLDTLFKPFYEYQLDAMQYLSPGNYWIGFQQGVATGIVVGYDRDIDHHTSLYFDSGNGWQQSQIYGSIMINPVFGLQRTYVGIKENFATSKNNTIVLYPNPANTTIQVKFPNTFSNSTNYSASIFDNLGREILTQNLTRSQINISALNNGIYIVCIYENNVAVDYQKVIIQH